MAAKRHYSPRKDWRSIKEDWIAVKLEAPTLTHRQFADSRQLDYKQLRNRMGQEGWQDQLETRREERDKKVGELMADRTAQVVEAVAAQFNETEVQIRTRHARLAQLLQVKGAERLRSVKAAELTVKEAIELVKLGEFIERRAFSLPDQFQLSAARPEDSGKFRSVAEHISNADKLRELGEEFLTFIEGEYSDVTDEEE